MTDTKKAAVTDKGKGSKKSSDNQQAVKPSKPTPASSDKKSAGGLGLFALILSVAIAGAGGFAYIKIQQQIDALSKQGQQESQDNQQAAKLLSDNLLEQLQTYQKISAEKLELLQEQVGKSKRQWLIAEAEYLVSVANTRLRLAADVDTALIALEAADQRLRKNGDPLTFPVREQIAKEISALTSAVLPDVIGLSSKLIALEAAVGNMEVSKLHTEIAKAAENLNTNGQAHPLPDNVEDALRDAWDNFSKLIVIRRHNQPLAALMTPEQVEIIRKNLALKLEAARLSLINQDQVLYSASISIVIEWLEDYFAPENPSVKAALKQLRALEKESIISELPDISLSLKMLRALPVLRLGNSTQAETKSTKTAPAKAQ
jgi:uncharacterized protein HemX